jgi:hypothetical protein
VAYADLGGLGPKQGAPLVWNWKAPSAIPAFLPWLMILGLLLLKQNRSGSAWWIWLPLVGMGGVSLVPQFIPTFLPSSQLDMMLEAISAMGFGVAALWLVSGYLGGKHRMLAFLGMVGAQGVFTLIAWVLGHGLEVETLQMSVPLAACTLVMAVGLSLAGLLCRGRYGWLRLSLWLLVMVAAVWLLIVGPLFLYVRLASGGRVPWGAFLGIEGVALLFTFGVLLPFLVLAFVNGFYRERLKGLLHLGAVVPPPVAPPAPAAPEQCGTDAGVRC